MALDKKAYAVAYREVHGAELNAAARAWRTEHPAEVVLYQAAWRAAHKQHLQVYDTNRKKNHRAKYTQYENNRRARKNKAGGSFTAEEFAEMCAEYGNKCIGPGPHSGKLTVDHVIPIALGGTSDISNIQPLCKSCNSRKHIGTSDFRKGAEK